MEGDWDGNGERLTYLGDASSELPWEEGSYAGVDWSSVNFFWD